MDEFNESSVNAEPVDTVEPQNNEQVETTTDSVNEDVTTSQVENKPVQTQAENANYANIRRESQQKGKDEWIASQGYTWNDKPITNEAEYNLAIAEQTREEQIQVDVQQGVPDDYARRLRILEDSDATTKAEKQELSTQKAELERQIKMTTDHEALSKDDTFGDYYNQYADSVKANANMWGVDLKTSMLMSFENNFKAYTEGFTKKASQDTINSIIKNGKSSPGSIAQGGEQRNESIYDLSNADFKKMQNEVMNGTRKNIN